LPCVAWPEATRPEGVRLTNAAAADVQALCATFDAFVIEGFGGQPHMKGFSPAFVTKVLAEAGQGTPAAKIAETWRHAQGDCAECKGPVAFYTATIAPRPQWRVWLGELSRAVRNADAILLPILTYAAERSFDDRGLRVAERAGGAALLLVDTASGQLLWAGGRDAAAARETLSGAAVQAGLAPPPWTETAERLFTEDLWRAFPGRLAP
jgi:hypothetical protein